MHRRGLQCLIERSGSRACLRHIQTAPAQKLDSPQPGPSTPRKKEAQRPRRGPPPKGDRTQTNRAGDKSYAAAVTGKGYERILDATPTKSPSKPQRGGGVPSRKPMLPPVVPSDEVQKFLAESPNEDAELETEPIDFVRPGMFVELRRNALCMHGVVMGQTVSLGMLMVVTLLSNGSILSHRSADITFMVPGFVDTQTISRCGKVKSAEIVRLGESEIAARLEVLKRIKEFERVLDLGSHDIAPRVEKVLQELHSTDLPTWGTVATSEVASRISGSKTPSVVTLLGVHKYLIEKYKQYAAPGASFLFSQTFLVRPKDVVDNLNYVDRLVAKRDPRITAFVEKARAIIASRPSPPPSASSGLTMVKHPDITFNEDDLAIIDFMRNYLRAKRTIQTDPHRNSSIAIMRLLGLYSDATLNENLAHKFLIEIGALSPWAELRRLGADRETNPVITNALETGVSAPGCPGPDEFYPQDIVAHLRHDFGDMPVYVIDESTAEELDDGLSVERDSASEGCYWVHVHIADPTSVLHPLHTISKTARELGSTQYFATGTEPMLPSSVAGLGISLGSSGEQKTLTFSFRVNESGEVTDYAVRPGVIRNVHVVTYQEVNELLGFSSMDSYEYPFGRPAKSTKSTSRLSGSHHIDNLRALDEVRRRLTDWTTRQNTFNVTSSNVSMRVEHAQYPDIVDRSRPHFFYGKPVMSYAIFSCETTRAQRIVAEAMKMASRVGSRFLRDHNVPGLRRTLSPPLLAQPESLRELLTKRNEHGEVTMRDLFQSGVTMPTGQYDVEVKGHWSMAIPEGEGYVRVTSPLRRFLDLLHHWQIKYALLGNKDPCFSQEWLSLYMTELEVQEKRAKNISLRDSVFWAVKFLEQFAKNPQLVDGRNPLEDLDVFTTGYVRRDGTTGVWRVQARVDSLGLKAVLLNVPPGIPSGTALRARYHGIQLGPQPALLLTPI